MINKSVRIFKLLIVLLIIILFSSCDGLISNGSSNFDNDKLITAYNSLMLKLDSEEITLGIEYTYDDETEELTTISFENVSILHNGVTYIFNGQIEVEDSDNYDLDLIVTTSISDETFTIILVQTFDNLSFKINGVDFSDSILSLDFNSDNNNPDEPYIFHEDYIENLLKAFTLLMKNYNTYNNNHAYLDEFDNVDLIVKSDDRIYTFNGITEVLEDNSYKLNLTAKIEQLNLDDIDLSININIDPDGTISLFDIDSHNYSVVVDDYYKNWNSTGSTSVVNSEAERNIAYWLFNNFSKYQDGAVKWETSTEFRTYYYEGYSNIYSRYHFDLEFTYDGKTIFLNGYYDNRTDLVNDYTSKDITITSPDFVKSYKGIVVKTGSNYYVKINGHIMATYEIVDNHWELVQN